MEANGVFRCDEDMEINGRYSFKSLLLDGEGMDEAGIDGAHLALTGDLEGVEETLYRDDVVGGRESFKSLLLDGENMEEDEVHFSPRDQNVGNDNHVQNSVLPTTAPAVVLGSEEVESISMDNHGVDCVDTQAVDDAEVEPTEETDAPPRKRKRDDDQSSAEIGGSNVPEHSLAPLDDPGCSAKHGPDTALRSQPLSSLLQPQPLSSLLQPQPSGSQPLPKRKHAEGVKTLAPSRKKRQGATSSNVQKLLDSVIARQELFFTDLLESMERKEAIRERMREEKEEKWRAEERAQLGIFNNAMLALTQELLGDCVKGNQLMDKAN